MSRLCPVNICAVPLEFKAGQLALKSSQEYEHSIHLDNDAFFYMFTEDESPTKSTVIGRPVLLALEDVDGAPSFLEKALRFVEDHGSSFMLSA